MSDELAPMSVGFWPVLAKPNGRCPRLLSYADASTGRNEGYGPENGQFWRYAKRARADCGSALAWARTARLACCRIEFLVSSAVS